MKGTVMKLEGKVALVTGGGRGIGRGIVLALAREGADTAIVGVTPPNAERVMEEVKKLGRRAIAIKADVTKWDQVQAMVKRTIEELGQLDILVNNAGAITVAPIEQITEEDFDRVMAVNVKGTFLCSKAVVPYMKQSGGGKIINLSSTAGKEGGINITHYSASKFAIVGFTNSLAKELGLYNITVNAICPGVVNTDMWDIICPGMKLPGESRDDTFQRLLTAWVPIGRPLTPEEMGSLAVFFATNDGVTGQSWNVDGGATAH
jgi:meso-butanediol dehydrogenase/(S,S)-butanediol dehydrogenase/diacetyl reductase